MPDEREEHAGETRGASPSGPPNQHLVTRLLEQASGGDSHAAAELLPVVYEELRRLARSKMAAEAGGGAGHTLQPTALVHEAYMRLLGTAGKDVRWDGRAHFFGAAARAMRRILIERARSRNRLKRGGGRGGVRVELDEAALSDESRSEELLALDEILDKLERHDKRKADVVMMRYFAGLSIEETAAALGVSPATVKNDWAFARAWLNNELTKERVGRADERSSGLGIGGGGPADGPGDGPADGPGDEA